LNMTSSITGCNASIHDTVQVNSMSHITIEIFFKNLMCAVAVAGSTQNASFLNQSVTRGSCQNCMLTFCFQSVCNNTQSFEVSPGVYNETVLVKQPTGNEAGAEFIVEVRLKNRAGFLETSPQVVFIELEQGLYLGTFAGAELRTGLIPTAYLFNTSVAGIASFHRLSFQDQVQDSS